MNEKTDYLDIDPHLATKAYETLLNLGSHAIQFASIERAPMYSPEHAENDAEHSFMLALVAPEMAALLRPDLDPGLVSQFATVHDLIELETGDTVTFDLSETEITQKEASEYNQLDVLIQKLPTYTGNLVRRYELQEEPEALFVRICDKCLPLLVNIHGAGVQVMQSQFGIETSEHLAATEARLDERLCKTFPQDELHEVHTARRLLAEHFQQQFETASTTLK